MKKVFGFFANKKQSAKLFYAFVAVSSCLVLLFSALALTKIFGSNDVSVAKASKSLNNYEMNITYNGDYSFNVTQKFEYTNTTGDSLKNVMFNLYSTAFSDGAINKPVSQTNIQNAYPNGVSYGKLNIENVNLNNKKATYNLNNLDKNVLQVDFEKELKSGEKAVLNFDYNFSLPNIKHRYGYGDNFINVANFYPVLAVYENGVFLTDPYHYNGDPFYTEASNYKVNIKVPKTMVVANTGAVVNTEVEGNFKTLAIEAKAVRDFAFIMSEKFTVIEDKWQNISIKYYYYKDIDPAKSLQAAKDSIRTFSETFGMYPYSTYSVVQTGFVHGGMEYPNVVMISDDIEKHSDYVNVIVHETAHQWWYQLVGSNAFRTPWQDEGLTEFSTALFYEKNPEYKVSLSEIVTSATGSYVSFAEMCEEVVGSFNSTMNRALNEYDTEQEYVYITYVKGMLLFDNLRSLIGNKAFEEGLKIYVKTYSFKNADLNGMINSFERASAKSLTGFFNSWVEGKVVIKSPF